MNLSSQRIWCYLCETEVFRNQRRNSLVSNESERGYSPERTMNFDRNGVGESCSSSCAEDEEIDEENVGGLVGLQNIANTCYMNAAIQALSNSPPLTGYFLECGGLIEETHEVSPNQRKFGLAKSYQRLIQEMWSKNRRSNHNGYVVPSGILYGIRNAHPMFRGFQQHDTQEFLRCFMDQLHEELKEITPPPPDVLFNNRLEIDDEERSQCSSPSLSQSEAEYETCDSGVSEQSSLSDEGFSSNIKDDNVYFRTCNSPQLPTLQQQPNQYNQRNRQSPLMSNRSNSASSLSSAQTNQSKNNQKDESLKPPHRSIISDVFDGKLLSSVQCLTCDRVSINCLRKLGFFKLNFLVFLRFQPEKRHSRIYHYQFLVKIIWLFYINRKELLPNQVLELLARMP